MEPATLILAACFTPFVAFFIALVFLMKQPKLAQGVVIGGGLISVACTLMLLMNGPLEEPIREVWFRSGQLELAFGFILDGLSLWFGFVVALITLCIQTYSLGYMSHDPGKTRFFAMLGLFGWAMLTFVYSVDLLQAFIFWELVGLASFFLIGFWYEKPSAANAARKAFIMTRVGDVGLFIGILLILKWMGTFDIPALLAEEGGLVSAISEQQLTLVTLLIFVGIMGKSAQFPLHTWLPDAMEGPTPVSALLHSATMVAAGVYLFARLFPLFEAAETTLLVVLSIAAFTAVLSSTIAMVENDIKKVLAYSSISQLGFMLLGLASGSLFAGVFHLITHAIFKALLFLCAGSYIHHFETNDMQEIGRKGGRRMVFTTIGLVVGGAALAGVPGLAGFFSKEAIFGSMKEHAPLIFSVAAYIAAFLTSYYSFRMIFLVGLPDKIEEQHSDHHHAKDSPWVMLAPMMLLSVGAVGMWVFGGNIAEALHVHPKHEALVDMLPPIIIGLAGIALAWWDFGRKAAPRTGFVTQIKPLYTLFRNRWYIDDFYNAVVIRITDGVAAGLALFERKGLDGGFDGFATGLRATGTQSTRLQNGWVQLYAGIAIVMVGVLAAYIGME